MTNVRNVDDILVPREQAMLAKEPIPAQPAPVPVVEIITPEPAAPIAPMPEPIAPTAPEPEAAAAPAEAPQAKPLDSPIDEYGNPVEKPKMYSEDDVNRLMRDRMSRGKYAEQPQPELQQQTQGQEPGEDWQQELKKFVKQTMTEAQKEQQQLQWQRDEAVRQAEFQDKFTTGMNRYQDFKEVTSGKNITNSMMLAARNLENPAAFVYGACKLHPQEVDRISRIADPYAQAAEIGRLHEKMVKQQQAASKAPRPLEPPKGDVTQSRKGEKPNIDQLILADANAKFGKKRNG
jgi:hypothetical protein